jgi:2-polyprenyl-3-methyl-5-hydroxy-6-metoxy-1,4-benzoquinol methylase
MSSGFIGMETAATLSVRAKRLYAGAGGFSARLQILRPYICPFELIVPHVPAGAAVLDVGCGAGLFIGLLADSGRISSGLGFDSSGSAIGLARQMAKNLSANAVVTFRQIDARAEWPSETFDVVSLVDVLHHVPVQSQLSVLSQAIARVRPGGLLLYKDMAERPYWRALFNRIHDLLLAREWIHYLPIARVEQHLLAQGMTQVSSGSAARYWYAHEWRIFQRL